MNIKIHPISNKRHEDGLMAISIHIPELDLNYNLDLPFRGLYERCGIPDLITLDFLLVASLCYVIDKIVPRSNTPDHWTREFEVEFPVSSSKIWGEVVHNLEKTLRFLTGDEWRISFYEPDFAFFRRPIRRRHRRRRFSISKRDVGTAICLFSGGLDSLVGAIDLLADGDRKLLLMGHYDVPGPASQQRSLFAEIQKYYRERVELVQTRVSHKPAEALELSLRSRSLVFMALGIYAARSFGPNVPLYIPENGFIAINIPLTPSRSGSCSTRTMHPFFLDNLTTVLRGLGFENKIINPLGLNTKGECILLCRDQTLLQSLINTSVSCSHGSRKQYWIRKEAKNCGYCVPCIIRRAALHKGGYDNGHRYGVDICEGELALDDERDSGDDLRAVLDFLRYPKTAQEISREIRSVAPVANLEEYTAVIERGFDEIRMLFYDKAKRPIRQAAGIKGYK